MGEKVNVRHKELASGKWAMMSLTEQMANIGSEISRALNWQNKGNMEYCRKSASRALELLDLSLACAESYPRLKELARLREAIVDYFFGENEYSSSEHMWRRYFDYFILAARK
jgi:hypothetical protein